MAQNARIITGIPKLQHGRPELWQESQITTRNTRIMKGILKLQHRMPELWQESQNYNTEY